MALIKCSECKHEVSDKAEACPSCGYPIAKYRIKKKKKISVKKDSVHVPIPNPLFPELPKDMKLGKTISEFLPKYSFIGGFKSEDCFTIDFIMSKKLEVSLCEYGLKISENESSLEERDYANIPTLELHFSTLISLKKTNLTKLYRYDENDYKETPLTEKLFCSQPFDFGYNETHISIMEREWNKTALFVINYWNQKYRQPETFIIRGSNGKIIRFINTVENAMNNYKNGIPNVPKTKADNIFTIALIVIILAIIITILVGIVRNIFF